MKSRTTFLIAILLLSLPSVLRAEDFVTLREQVLALGKLTAPPETHDAEAGRLRDVGGLAIVGA